MIATLLADPSPRPRPKTQSSVRISRPPALEAPFDDERHSDHRHGAAESARDGAQLDGRWTVRSHGRLDGRVTAPVRAELTDLDLARPEATGVTQTALVAGASPTTADGPTLRDTRPVQPEVTSTRAAMRYVRLCIEVLNGFRPAGHLRSLGGPVEFTDIVTQLRYRRNGHAHFRTDSLHVGSNGAERPTDERPGRPANRAAAGVSGRTDTAQTKANRGRIVDRPIGPERNAATVPAVYGLTRLRVSEPLDGIAEVVAVLSHAGASIAMALRLERRGADWTCTLVQVV